ncbi:hypothetical protein DES40_0887 [Litorimonas taeanensis]|uniref:Uncharacterized protein n=1 Tax=Litorimonas taeanensis TaxID=568099 RepID=A0A420WKX7_9PROT|nr:hypothetical protein DES40_0887 [Litorimonas taeanensis]
MRMKFTTGLLSGPGNPISTSNNALLILTFNCSSFSFAGLGLYSALFTTHFVTNRVNVTFFRVLGKCLRQSMMGLMTVF